MKNAPPLIGSRFVVWEGRHAKVVKDDPGPGYVDFFVNTRPVGTYPDYRPHYRGWVKPQGWRFWRLTVDEARQFAIKRAKAIERKGELRDQKIRETRRMVT